MAGWLVDWLVGWLVDSECAGLLLLGEAGSEIMLGLAVNTYSTSG